MMEATPKKRKRSEFDQTKCIICQTSTNEQEKSYEDGRKRIIEASTIRRDDVTERLSRTDNDCFVYHVSNNCYKRYTHKTLLEKLQSGQNNVSVNEKQNDSVKSENNRHSRSQIIVRPVPNVNVPKDTKNICIVCGQIKCKGEVVKYRISECDRAKKFLSATVYFQDNVYVRTCDLQDEHAVFGADIYYHSNCLRNYLKKYDDENTPRKRKTDKRELFLSIVNELEPELYQGRTISLSELMHKANSTMSKTEKQFTNREVRVLLTEHYGSNLCISESLGKEGTFISLSDKMVENSNIATSRKYETIEECGKVIRECFLNMDFKLDDKFGDAYDLKESWEQTVIPDPVVEFFSGLLNLDYSDTKSSLNTAYQSICPVEDNEDERDDDFDEKLMSAKRKMTIQALHQIMFYNVHNGRKKTPLHMMNAQAIHEKCKSKELITSLNHYGLCMSYSELQRYHNDMGSYIVATSAGNIPLQSQLDPEMFTIGAFDNFDHDENTLSGIGGSHDCVSVLFQDKSSTVRRKPNKSDTTIESGTRVFTKQLPSQEIREYTKPMKRPTIPETYAVSKNTLEKNEQLESTVKSKDTAWTVARLDLSNIEDCSIKIESKDQTMPSWGAFNSVVTSESLCEKAVGFLPVIPHPVTEYSTVYTALKNFQDTLIQLKQNRIAITCDEGVYHIAREIQLSTGDEFSDIVLCLGSFHMAKIFLGCLGKYVRNSGAESIWTENEIFGPQVVQSVLSGTHYARSVKGHFLLSEAMLRLQWGEFFKVNGIQRYQKELAILRELKQAVSEKGLDKSRRKLEEFKASSHELNNDFTSFKTEQAERSETSRYWNTYIELVHILKNLIRADREGDWILHLSTVQRMLPIFAVFDSVNYLRWCSLYLEDMRKLAETASEIHEEFMKGKFVVKRTLGKFKAVAADQDLEQTINRSQKSSGGIIGSTRRKEYVALWEIIYHEMLEVSTVHREISGSKPYYHELTVSHEFTESETKARESNINDMTSYIQLYDNPFQVTESTEHTLHNVITQEVMTQEIRASILEIESHGSKLYDKYRQERFVEKSKRLTDTIHRNNMKSFQSITAIPKQSSSKKKKKDSGPGHKVIEIAQSRGNDTKELFQYDLTDENYLFDEQDLMKKPNKAALCHELEKKIEIGTVPLLTHSNTSTTTYLVDVMANARKINLKGLKTFGDMCASFIQMTSHICKRAGQIDFVFDSYIDGSVKDSERQRRSTVMPVELNVVNEDTPLPVNIATFWPSNKNKEKFQLLLRKWIKDNCSYLFPEIVIILSGMKCNDNSFICKKIRSGSIHHCIDLELPIEEADVRLLPHAIHASKEAGTAQIVVLSADTDVMVLMLYIWKQLHANGLEKLWIRAGVADTTRYIPLHLIAVNSQELCGVLPAAHILSGCDSTSKFGTKLAALKANPEMFLKEFGTELNNPKQAEIIDKAEEYLVQVIKYKSTCKTMDELRYVLYHHSKVADIKSLPPTSSSTRQHLLRCWYTTYTQIRYINMIQADPREYGYELRNELLMPSNIRSVCPDNLAIACHCKNCSTKRCVCRKANIRCCVFCKCSETSTCVNPCVVLTIPIVL